MFGGGFFGKPIKVNGQQGSQVPMGGAGSPVGKPLGVVPQGQAVQVNRPTAAPAGAAPQAGFQPQPLIPPTRVPMGKKGDCPICH